MSKEIDAVPPPRQANRLYQEAFGNYKKLANKKLQLAGSVESLRAKLRQAEKDLEDTEQELRQAQEEQAKALEQFNAALAGPHKPEEEKGDGQEAAQEATAEGLGNPPTAVAAPMQVELPNLVVGQLAPPTSLEEAFAKAPDELRQEMQEALRLREEALQAAIDAKLGEVKLPVFASPSPSPDEEAAKLDQLYSRMQEEAEGWAKQIARSKAKLRPTPYSG